MPTPEEVMKVIAENMPSPSACSAMWNFNGDTATPAADATEDTKAEWSALADAVISLFQR